MAYKVSVALDAMGGDNAPGQIVKGAVDAVNIDNEIFVYLVGRQELIKEELSKYTYNNEQIEVVDARDVIETGEAPVMAVRRKKDSSLVKALTMVKEKKADAFVSGRKLRCYTCRWTGYRWKIKGRRKTSDGATYSYCQGSVTYS